MLNNGTITIVSSFRTKAESHVLLVILSVIWGLAFVAITYHDFELGFVDLTLFRGVAILWCVWVSWCAHTLKSTKTTTHDG